jgi:hypothetical protein
MVEHMIWLEMWTQPRDVRVRKPVHGAVVKRHE